MPSTSHHSGVRDLGRGQTAVIAMLLIGLAAAAFAWWWNFNRGRRTLEFYGPEAARLIRTAPRVEFLKPPPEANVDLSKAPGLINARASLLSDASFDWDQSAPPPAPPLFTVRFSDGERFVDVTFDFENRTLRTSSNSKTVVLKNKTGEGWRGYLAKHAGLSTDGAVLGTKY